MPPKKKPSKKSRSNVKCVLTKTMDSIELICLQEAIKAQRKNRPAILNKLLPRCQGDTCFEVISK